jgi:hypothetical protein
MTTQLAETCVSLKARNAGIVYAIVATTAGLARGLARSPLFMHSDATAAALNVLTAEPLFRLGLAANLVGVVGYAVLTLVVPHLFKLASAGLFVTAAFFGVMGSSLSAARALFHLAPMLLLAGVHHLIAF